MHQMPLIDNLITLTLCLICYYIRNYVHVLLNYCIICILINPCHVVQLGNIIKLSPDQGMLLNGDPTIARRKAVSRPGHVE